MITLPKIENNQTNSSSSCKTLILKNTIYKTINNNLTKSLTSNNIKLNKTFKLPFHNIINKNKDIKLTINTPENEILKNITFIKNPIIDKEIEKLRDRFINDNIFTQAIKSLSYNRRDDYFIRKKGKKRTIYGLNFESNKEIKKENFILKNYFPLYFPNIILRNEKNKHYSKNILKSLNSKLFSSENLKTGVGLDHELFEKKFEEEVKKYQLSKIIELNNLMQNDENIATINNLEELEKNNFNNNIEDGHLFHIRENNFNVNRIYGKNEKNESKSDLKDKEKSKDTNNINKCKSFYKKKNKHNNNLFDKKDLIKNVLNQEEPEITNYESRIYYCQNLSTSNRNEEGNEGINQDSFLQLFSVYGNKKFHLFGVMDGHGVNGHIISKYISRFISEYFYSDKIKSIFKNCNNNDEIYHILITKKYSFINNLIYKCNLSLDHHLNYECNNSGSTCLLIFMIGNNLICANIGNSRAILLEKTELLQLSIDQTLNDPEELKRIIKKGGKIKKIKKRIVLDNMDNNNFEISRSLGDKILKNIGIIYEPVITEYTLNKKSKYLIIGTQGLWKGLSNEKACIYVNKSIKLKNPLDSCRLLTQKAEESLKKSSSFRDDITIITIFFEEMQTNFIKNAVYE